MVGTSKIKDIFHEKMVAPQQKTAAIAVCALIIGVVALAIALKGGK